MILPDSSAWIEYLRATESDIDLRLTRLVDTRTALATTEVVVMEVLAGARDDRHLAELRDLLARCQPLNLAGVGDFEEAASLYRTCRRAGETVRKMVDCVIAAVAIRNQASVLHRDSDFEVLARHTPLHVEQA